MLEVARSVGDVAAFGERRRVDGRSPYCYAEPTACGGSEESLMMKIAMGGLGFVLILFVLFEAFEALVLPRRVVRPFRFTRLYYRTLWPCWGALAGLAPPRQR